MSEGTLFDPGLQPERTELAWRRTALALAIGSLLSLRVLPFAVPASAEPWGIAPGVLGLLAACVLWIAARRRQIRVTAVLTGASSGHAPGGGLIAVAAALGSTFGVIALVIVVSSVWT